MKLSAWMWLVLIAVAALTLAVLVPQLREALLAITGIGAAAAVQQQRREGRKVIHEAEQEHRESTEARNRRTETAIAARERAEQEAATREPAQDLEPVSDEERAARLAELERWWRQE